MQTAESRQIKQGSAGPLPAAQVAFRLCALISRLSSMNHETLAPIRHTGYLWEAVSYLVTSGIWQALCQARSSGERRSAVSVVVVVMVLWCPGIDRSKDGGEGGAGPRPRRHLASHRRYFTCPGCWPVISRQCQGSLSTLSPTPDFHPHWAEGCPLVRYRDEARFSVPCAY